MKSLSNFANEEIHKKENNTKISEEDVANLYNQYKNMSQDDLLKKLFTEVDKQKKDGTFNLKSLENAVDNISAFLTDEQIKNIKSILKQM